MQYLKNTFIDMNDPDLTLPKKDIKRVPPNWSAYKVRDKTWIRCEFVNSNGSKCCAHISKERFTKLTQDQKAEVLDHPHTFPAIERYLENNTPHHDAEDAVPLVTLDILQKKLILFLGKNNLPLQLASSPLLKDLLMEAYVMGTKTPTVSPGSKIKIPARSTISRNLINMAAIVFDMQVNLYKELQYVGIAIDAGKVGSTNYLECYIMNANTSLKPLLLLTEPNFPGNQASYMKAIQQCFAECTRLHLTPVGFIGDNLRVQWSAFEQAREEMGFIAISCGCHSLNLAINDTKESNEIFGTFCEKIKLFSELMNRKNVQCYIGVSCLSYIETRWTIITDICIWTDRNSSKILQMLMNPQALSIEPLRKHIELMLEVLFDIVPRVLLLLLPLKLLSEKMEADATSVCDIYPLTRSAQLLMSDLVKDHQELCLIFNSINENVDRRLTRSKSGLLQYMAFTFTMKGREVVRAQQRLNVERESEIYRKDFRLGIDKYTTNVNSAKSLLANNTIAGINRDQAATTIIGNCSSLNLPPVCSIEGLNTSQRSLKYMRAIEFNRIDDEDEWRAYDEAAPNAELPILYPRPVTNEPIDSQRRSTNEGMSEANRLEVYYPEQEMIADIIQTQQYQSEEITDYLGELAQRFYFDAEEVIAEYYEFLSSDTLNKVSKLSRAALWTYLSNSQFKHFAELAYMITTLAAAEAICERGFSNRRRICHDERINTGLDLAAGRTTLMKATEVEMYSYLNLPLRA